MVCFSSNDDIKDESKLEVIADNNSNVAYMTRFFPLKVKQTLWDKKKILVTSVFASFHNVSSSFPVKSHLISGMFTTKSRNIRGLSAYTPTEILQRFKFKDF